MKRPLAPRWTEAEYAQILACRERGMGIEEISKVLYWRTRDAIQQRINKLVAEGKSERRVSVGRPFSSDESREWCGVRRAKTLELTGLASWDEYQTFVRNGFTRRELIARHRGGVS